METRNNPRDNSPSVYLDDDGAGPVVIYRASAIGGCLRMLTCSRLNYEQSQTPLDNFPYFQEGIDAEKIIVAECNRRGYEVFDRERTISLNVSPSLLIRGHIDGVARRNHKPFLLEMKNFGDDFYEQWVRNSFNVFPRYAYQVSAYMIATQLPLLMAVRNKEHNNTYSFSIHTQTPITKIDLFKRVLEVERYARLNELPQCDNASFPCPYFYTHEEKIPLSVQEPALLDLLHRYETYADDVRLLTKRRDEVRDKLIQELSLLSEASNYPGDYYDFQSDRVTVVHSSSSVLDKQLISKAGIDLAPYYKKVPRKPYLKITKESDDVSSSSSDTGTDTTDGPASDG